MNMKFNSFFMFNQTSTNNNFTDIPLLFFIILISLGLCSCCLLHLLRCFCIFIFKLDTTNNNSPKKKIIEVLFGSVASPNLTNIILNHLEIRE